MTDPPKMVYRSTTSIMYHEFGHLLGKIHKVDCEGITKELLRTDSIIDIVDKIESKLSIYASKYLDCSEVISEAMSAYLSGVNNNFALQFLKASDIIK